MNKTPSEAKALVEAIAAKVSGAACDVVVCPTAICIPSAIDAANGTNIAVGAQNVHFKENGAYTGELAGNVLKEAGLEYVIIGHSERRQYFGETDETVNLRTQAALATGLIPIVCVGESLIEREQGQSDPVSAVRGVRVRPNHPVSVFHGVQGGYIAVRRGHAPCFPENSVTILIGTALTISMISMPWPI